MLGMEKCSSPAKSPDDKESSDSKRLKTQSPDPALSDNDCTTENAQEINWDMIELNIEDEEAVASNLLMSSSAIKQNKFSSSECLIENEDYHCFFCPLVFPHKRQLREHLHKYHADRKLCFFCKKRFTSLFVLVEHLNLSHSRKNFEYKCLSCTGAAVYTSCSPFKFLRHINLLHTSSHADTNNTRVVVPPFILYNMCRFCKCGFKLPDNLFLHLVMCHDIDYRFIINVLHKFNMLGLTVILCRSCPMVFQKAAQFKEHSEEYCKYFRKHYQKLTRFCEGCRLAGLRKGMFGNVDQHHSFCANDRCYLHPPPRTTPQLKSDCYIAIYKHAHNMPVYCRAVLSPSLFDCGTCGHMFYSFANRLAHHCSAAQERGVVHVVNVGD